MLATAVSLADEHADWQSRMQPITPKNYLCPRTTMPLVIDGKLDEAAWTNAAWTADFVDIQGTNLPAPRFHTRAKMLWDDNYLYIAAELAEPHVWATLTNHDAVIFQDPDFEVFMDPKGETQSYYEFEMNALNTTWDLMLDKPYMDGGHPHDEWEIPGTKTAVQIHGTLNNPADTDQGWTVEIAFPWNILSQHARHAGPPTNGESWRINFSRVEWQITQTNGVYQKLPNVPEDNWVWSPQGVIDMHRPEMWGVVQFTSAPVTPTDPMAKIPGKPARDLALAIYYAQRDFFKTHDAWATNLAELPEVAKTLSPTLPAGVEPPVIQSTTDGYACQVGFQENGQSHVWRIRQDRLLKLDEPLPVETEKFITDAQAKYGDPGWRAAYFLVDNMPPGDRATLSHDFLMDNLDLAMTARHQFPWAATVPERIYFNDVLPYASLDEPRDPWRADFFRRGSEIVRGCQSTVAAAQALNRELFKQINVHYNLGRKRNNQSPKESIEQGKATCTGLSIILVDACRAVGVPARLVGVPEWGQKEGNHTWVEIWDDRDGQWHFTGADEYDPSGLDRGWFNNDAAITSRSTDPFHQIYASSWRHTSIYFPMSWNDTHDVPGVNVSARYAALATDTNANNAQIVHLRLLDKLSGTRLAALVEMRNADGQLLAHDHTRADTADLNDMPDFKLPAGAANVVFRFSYNGEARETIWPCALCTKSSTFEFDWNDLSPVPAAVIAAENWLSHPLTERGSAPDVTFSTNETARLIALAWNDIHQSNDAVAAGELAAKKIVLDGQTLKWVEKDFGDEPDGRHSLWITLHGGGQGTEAENDANWKGYLGRYEFPPGSINIAPRAPANTWDMWHVPWTDGLLDRLIADLVLQRKVDPDRVYLIGYSAGGDGVYQLAPRMSDRFAAATMCAGHPNNVTPEGLRNLPFLLYMGGADAAYNRNVIVREFSAKMDALQAADPEGYWHRLTVYPSLPHSMQNREAEMIPRMAPLRRNDWPKRVVWLDNDNLAHLRMYWLEHDPATTQTNAIYAAHVDGQIITIESPAHGQLTLRLSDALLNLDQPVRVVANGKTIFEGQVKRSLAAIVQSLQERADPATAATALLPVSW
ncbi:MAG TPA: sugar-binding protein [Verrucomicrobiae bacterium]|jgi:hypothetical protein